MFPSSSSSSSASSSSSSSAQGLSSTVGCIGFQTTNPFFPASLDSNNWDPMEEHRNPNNKLATSFQPSSSDFLGVGAATSPAAMAFLNHLALNAQDMSQGSEMRTWNDTTHQMRHSDHLLHNTLINRMEPHHQSGQCCWFSLGMPSMEESSIPPYTSAVPCKIRAKRGCATNPRSIAERERRTKISTKLKKLHDVIIPDMDKQTNYADMLELAIEHIQSLQIKVKKLNSNLEACTCGRGKNTTADSL